MLQGPSFLWSGFPLLMVGTGPSWFLMGAWSGLADQMSRVGDCEPSGERKSKAKHCKVAHCGFEEERTVLTWCWLPMN